VANVYEFFLQNWVNQVTMETAWKNTINVSAENLVHEGRSLVARPRRTISIRWDAIDQGEAHRAFFTLARMGNQRLRIPLYQDVAKITASSTLSTINVVTTSKRFYVGQRVVMHERTSGRPSNVQYGVIQTVNANSLILTAPITGTYPAGAVVYPVMDVEIVLGASGVAVTDHVATLQLSFLELAVGALPESNNWDDLYLSNPSDYTNSDDEWYVLDPDMSPNWSRDVGIFMQRAGNERGLGRDHVVTTRGPRPQYAFRYSADRVTKAEAHRMLSFFDAHKGRLIPFIVPNPLSIFNVENMGVAFVDVTRQGDIDDPSSFVSYVFLKMRNGNSYVRTVTGVTDNGGLNRLAVTPNLPAMLAADVVVCTTAHLCRFAKDSLSEVWHTDTVATFEVDVVEVLNEEYKVVIE
jgi:ribosomal protein L35AE/L33A